MRAERDCIVTQPFAGIRHRLFRGSAGGRTAFEKFDHVGRHEGGGLAARSVAVRRLRKQPRAGGIQVNDGAVREGADALEAAELRVHFKADEFHPCPAVELFFIGRIAVGALRQTLSC